MPEGYQRITKILVWVVAFSMIAYFVITPFTYYRPTPQQVSPGSEAITPTTTINIPEAKPLEAQLEPSTELPTEMPEDLLPAGPGVENDLLEPPAGRELSPPKQQPLPTAPRPGQE